MPQFIGSQGMVGADYVFLKGVLRAGEETFRVNRAFGLGSTPLKMIGSPFHV